MAAADAFPTRQKIDLTPFPMLYRGENIFLHKLFRKYGYDLRICGGAVRDVLLGISPKDIDYATDATPNQMNEMFSKENIRTLNRNGEAHGTVTVRINDSVNFEVTTLRIDVDPDGRHTKVIFTNDWSLDAERRDLTVNSMFIAMDLSGIMSESSSSTSEVDNPPSPDNSSFTKYQLTLPVYGWVYDFFNGRDDLAHRRIRFVGNPRTRIREDYLRILRYFRFYGRLVRESDGNVHEEETMKAISELGSGLSDVSGERCWIELRSILTYWSTPSLLRRMHDLGLFPFIGFPDNPNFEELSKLWKRDILKRNPNPTTCLSAILSTFDEVETLNNRLKLSNQDLTLLIYILKHRDEFMALTSENALRHCQREFILSSIAQNKLRPIIIELMNYAGLDSTVVEQFRSWEPPRFPLNGLTIKEKWAIPNRDLNRNILALKRQWLESGFTLECDDLLSEQNKATLQLPSELPNQFELNWLKKKARQ